MRFLLTGGAGFIGQHLARSLTGHDLVALDVLAPQVHLDPAASRSSFPGKVLVGDVADPATWDAVGAVDAVVHLAAETGTAQSMYEVDRYRRVNVTGTRLAGEFAAERGVPLVALSSRAVYGEGRYGCPNHAVTFGARCCPEGRPEASTEADPHHPVSVYGETKSLGEDALAATARGVPVTIVRPQNVIGPGQALHNPYTGVLAAFLARLREGLPLLVYGDGSATRDFVHVSDVAALLTWALAQPPQAGAVRVLNCGTGVRTTLTELAAAAILGSPVGGSYEHVQVHRAGDIEHACADLTRLRQAGAPMPRWSAQEAVTAFIRASWDRPGAAAGAWDDALTELTSRGLAE